MRRGLLIVMVLPVALLHASPTEAEPLGVQSRFVPIGPVRILDTRVGIGAAATALAPGGSVDLKITGTAGIPSSNVVAVAMNVTATRAAGPGFVQVFPTGQTTVGSSSNLNVELPGQTIPNFVVVPIGDAGKVSFYAQGGADLLADALGYFEATPGATSAGRYTALTPTRVLDTRAGLGMIIANPGDTVDCGGFTTWAEANRYFWRYYERYGDVAKLDANNDQIPCESLYDAAGRPPAGKPANAFMTSSNSTVQINIVGLAGVPASGVSAVVLNVTATDALPGFISVSPGTVATATSSNLNVTPTSPTIANIVVVPVAPSGIATIYTESPAHLLADVAGYFTDATAPSSTVGLFVPLRPARILDTRNGVGVTAGKVLPAGSVTVAVRGASGTPNTAVAAFLNVTATQATNPGFVQVLPAGQATVGSSSNLNVTAVGQTIAGAAFATLSTTSGQISVYTQSGAQLLADIAGYFTGATPAPSGANFGAPNTFSSGVHPHASVIADFNGDTNPDIAVANAGSNSVTVRLGDGHGAFGPATNFAVGSEPKSVAARDLNGDGKLDLVTANQISSDVSVLLGNGAGGFAAAVSYAAAPNAHEAAIGDLNGDGKLDLAVVGWGGPVMSVLLGNGTGTFAAKVDYPVGAAPHSVVIADLNGDAKPDIAVANHDSGTASVLLGTGTGAFSAKVDYPVGSGPHSIRAGDLDGDGRPDLVVANDSSDSISVLRNIGSGVFATKVDYATTATPKSVALADVNGDGVLDVLVASIDHNYPTIVNAGGDRIGVFLGTGTNGSLGPRVDLAAGTGAFSVTVGDVNKDGKPDLVITNWHDNAIQVRLNLG